MFGKQSHRRHSRPLHAGAIALMGWALLLPHIKNRSDCQELSDAIQQWADRQPTIPWAFPWGFGHAVQCVPESDPRANPEPSSESKADDSQLGEVH
jgi:hypothetical protein